MLVRAESVFVLALVLVCTMVHLVGILVLLLMQDPLLFILQPLLPLYIFEHVLVLWQDNIVRKYLRVFLIKLKHPGKSLNRFKFRIESFEKFTDIIEDEIIFEYRHDMSVFIVDYVIYDLHIVVFSAS